MNLVYGTNNYIVRYLQAFLQENYSHTVMISGVYDEETHKSLLEYLKLPNVETLLNVSNNIHDRYPYLAGEKSNSRLVGGLFIENLMANSIRYISKDNNEEARECIDRLKQDGFYEFVESMGWIVTEFTNYNNSDNEKLYITIQSSGRKNVFPNDELSCMINQFNNQYYYNLAIRDGVGIDDMVHYSSAYKVAIIPCKPNETFTIAHGYVEPRDIVIGSSQFYVEDILGGNLPVDNVVDFRDLREDSGEDNRLLYGSFITYTTTNNCKNLIVQMKQSSIGDLVVENHTVDIPIRLGDINQDDKIDETDRILLSTCITEHTQLYNEQLVAADINGDGEVDNKDLALLDKFLSGEIPNLGVRYYTKEIGSEDDMVRLLVVKGDSSLVPFKQYASDPWLVHDKFINYLLDMSITKYSDEDTIAYGQRLVSSVISEYIPEDGIYSDNMKEAIKRYQQSNGIYFPLGYIDVETEGLLRKTLDRRGVDFDASIC